MLRWCANVPRGFRLENGAADERPKTHRRRNRTPATLIATGTEVQPRHQPGSSVPTRSLPLLGKALIHFREPHSDFVWFACRYARVAQWIERWTSNPKVAGSSPAVGRFCRSRLAGASCGIARCQRAFPLLCVPLAGDAQL